jgi:DnaJ-class molecular chaperone
MSTINLNIRKICKICGGDGVEQIKTSEGGTIERPCANCNGEGEIEWGHAQGNI